MLPAPRINDVLHRVTFAAGWESPRSQVLGRLVSRDLCADACDYRRQMIHLVE
jgi:hypothetical protein